MKADVFTKPHIKSPGFQQELAGHLKVNPAATSIELAAAMLDWFMDAGRGVQEEVLSYAISHMRPNVEHKLRPKKDASKARKMGEAAAKRLIRLDRAKWLLSLTYEQLEAVELVGPHLRAKMQPGQKVKDAWSLAKVMGLLK